MKTKYKILIALTLAVVFGLGVAGGVLGERYVKHRADRRAAASRPRMPSPEDWAKSLALTQDQQDRIHEIFRRNDERMKAFRTENRAKLSDLRKQLRNEIDAVLTLEQKQKNDEMIRRFDEWRKKESERSTSHDRRDDSPQASPGRES
jgi:hypothetical protein